MHIFRRFGRLFKTLLLAVVLGALKVITLLLILVSVLLEAGGLFFHGTAFGEWLMVKASAKVANIIMLVEEVILCALQGHIVANLKYVKLFDQDSKLLSGGEVTWEKWPTGKPMPKADPTEIN